MADPSDVERRRAWFRAYIARQETMRERQRAPVLLPDGGAVFPCPCCGMPTIEQPVAYEICPICWWEDDGQDDPFADEVWGGPNGSLSLTQARQEFADALAGTGPDRDLTLKRHLLELGSAVMRAPPEDLQALWEQFRADLSRLKA